MTTEKKLSRPPRIFNDPVHGNIELNEACQLIVDTKEFQRLRDIKQLGFVDYVYPGATHTRFEHALGTYHLAGQYVRRLRDIWNVKYEGSSEGKQQKDEKIITVEDILCVEIAALCHDIGIGPFSTFFSKRFLPELEVTENHQMKHRNKLLFEHMLSMNGLEQKLESNFNLQREDILFIKEQIDGYETTGSTAWPYQGRKKEKAFLYEIVQNHRNGIDVCKFDYMARDCQNLGISNNFDAQRYMEFARIIEVDGELQICTRDKELGNLYNMFFTRYNLHKFAYQHPVVLGIEMMVTKLFKYVKDKKIIKIENLGSEVKFLEDKLKDEKSYSLEDLEEIYRQHSGETQKIYKECYKVSDLKKMIDEQQRPFQDQFYQIKKGDLISSLKKFIRMKTKSRKRELSLADILKFDDDNAKIAFTQLTDGFLFAIRNQGNETEVEDQNRPRQEEEHDNLLEEHDNLLERLYTRDLFKFIGESPPISKADLKSTFNLSDAEMEKLQAKEIEKIMTKRLLKDLTGVLNVGDIKVNITYLDFGMKDENPIHRLRVYSKNDLNTAKKMELKETISLLQGMNYNELRIRIFATFSTRNHQNSEKLVALKEIVQGLKDKINKKS